jgi:hypothetical protein
MKHLAMILGVIGFTLIHFLWYTRVVAYWLWELSGGIRQEGRLTEFGASDWAWTVPLHLPAGLTFYVNGGPLGVLLLLIGSTAAGFAAATIIGGIASRRRPRLGRCGWRLGLFLAGWAWVPVPSAISWVYQWTVVY